jgi:hypothetical protein
MGGLTVSLQAQDCIGPAWIAEKGADAMRAAKASWEAAGFAAPQFSFSYNNVRRAGAASSEHHSSLVIDADGGVYGREWNTYAEPTDLLYSHGRATVSGQRLLVVAPSDRELSLQTQGKFDGRTRTDPLGLKACGADRVTRMEEGTFGSQIVADAIRIALAGAEA